MIMEYETEKGYGRVRIEKSKDRKSNHTTVPNTNLKNKS